MTNDFNTWLDGAPVISFRGGEDFDIWLEGAPVIDTLEPEGATVTVTGVEIQFQTGTVVAQGAATVSVSGVEIEHTVGNVSAGEFYIVAVQGVEIDFESGTVTANGGIPVKQILARRRAMSWPPFLQGRRGWKGGSLGQKWL